MSSIVGELRFRSTGFAAMMMKWALPIAVILGLMVCEVYADFPCKTEQIHWIGTPGKRYKCLECPDCPAGSQPSVPCSSSVAYGTPVHCIPCQLGKTFSDKYGKAPCDACTVCSKGKTLKKNCTLSSNSECGSKCAHGFYPVPFIFTCMSCTECCNDSKDEIAKECANYGKKCKVRTTPCKIVHTTPSTTVITVHHRTSTALQTTHPGTSQSDSTTLLRTDLVQQFSTVPSTTLSRSNRQVEGNKSAAMESAEQNNSENKTLIIVSTVSALIATLGILVLIVVIVRGRPITHDMCRWNRSSIDGIELSQPGYPVSFSQEQLNQTLIPLRILKSVSLDAYEKVWKRLDKKPKGTKKGDFSDVAKHYGLGQEDIWELEKEFKTSGSGSPSRQLLEYLEAKRPELTVLEFTKVLQKPNIDRVDIVDILKKYIYRS